MTVSEYLTSFSLEHEHAYENATLLKWLNTVESNVYGDTIKEYLNVYYPRVLNTYQFSLPSGIDFEDITKVFINGRKYKKKDTRAYKEDRAYWYEGGKLCIYPVCSQTDSSYVSGAGELTFASSTITTTGDDFTGISVGDVILVDGCTVNASNDKYATVIGIATKVLTFAPGTFVAGLETGAVTIYVPKIKVTYQNKPTPKLIANIATDTLLIPDRFNEAYEYFFLHKIAYNAKDYNEAANHMAMFNNKVANYETWWEAHRPQSPETDIQAEEYWESGSSVRFDTED